MRFFLYLTGFSVVTWLISGYFSRSFTLIPAIVFLFSSISCISIEWCINHKQMIEQLPKQWWLLLMILSPLLASLLSLVEPAFSYLYFLIASSFGLLITSFGWHSFILLHPVIQGGIISTFFLFYFIIGYLLFWAFTAPLTFVYAIIAWLSVLFAKLVDKIAPTNNFFGLTMIIEMIIVYLARFT